MAKLLFLAHRIPYPPNKGDKIRSFHWLKHLADKHRVYLGAFVDDSDDWQFQTALREYCQELCLRPLARRRATLRSLRGLVQGCPLSLPYYWDRDMKKWVQRLLEAGEIDRIFVFSSAMAQYVNPEWRVPKIIDFVDVDSDKWRQYADNKSWGSAWIYHREARKLLQYDRQVAADFDLSLFVSAREAELFKQLAPEAAQRVDSVPNGVDLAYFSGDRQFPCPYQPGEQALVFTGAMDYWANVDAVRWFASAVFPRILQHHVEARFYIVGARPTETVKALARREGIVVTGGVDDIRPYLAHARLAVAPLRIARGIQNKVLEAMAMAKPVLATSMAMEGLDLQDALPIAVADDPEEMAQIANRVLNERTYLPRVSSANRSFVEKHYNWETNLRHLDAFLEKL